jgi:hypothetical protein
METTEGQFWRVFNTGQQLSYLKIQKQYENTKMPLP